MYPLCPAFNQYTAGRRAFQGIDPYQGRKGLELFSEAGLEEVRVDVYCPPESCVYPGVPSYEELTGASYDAYAKWMRQTLDLEGPWAPRLRRQIASGLVDEETVVAAQRELDAWLAHPNAFSASVLFLAAGRVP